MAEYLEHYGVKGMRWGHRKDRYNKNHARKKKAKEYQKTLRSLDAERKTQTVALSNASISSRHYAQKAKQAQSQGLIDEAQHFSGLSDAYTRKVNQISKDSVATGKKIVNTVVELEKSGYSWKVTPTNFNIANVYKYEKNLNEAQGLSSSTNQGSTNASSGNLFSVKDSNSMSEKDRQKWKGTHGNVQRYNPQQVYYRYYYM